jgi:tRNA pseudouridine32 synthase/23S rRNA pseudouridine746 synthase
MTPEEMVARLLYRDGLMLVIDKPAGMAVHRGPKGGESLEDHFDALRFGLPRAPALAHRLDRDTSGCLVLGRHRKALAALGKMFKNGKVGKTYWAVVEGGPTEDEGRIDIPLGKRDESRGWWMKPDPEGMPSTTTWKVLGRFHPSPAGRRSSRSDGMGTSSTENAATPPGAFGATLPLQGRDLTWLAMEPVTGRTHQLRVHAAESGWPIVGDSIYGRAPRTGGPILHLHSREVVVPISKNKPPVVVTAPVPNHMRERLMACGWKEEG